MRNYKIPTLTIAGSDSSGGAGVQADLKTFSAIGTYGMSVITAITAQNTQGVFLVEDLSKEIIESQINVVFEDIEPAAVKIGMVSSAEIVQTIVNTLKKYNPKYLIVDPVMISKSGYSLLKPEAKKSLIEELIPMAYIITPNTPEAEEITGMKINNLDDMREVGKRILELGPKYVLMKGGCTLSSAITSHLALGYDIVEAVKLSKEYITEAIRHSFDIGKGVGPVNHFYKFED